VKEKPNDRPKAASSEGGQADPKIYIIVDGKKFLRPGLETYFARPGGNIPSDGSDKAKNQVADRSPCSCDQVVGGAYCSCNKVCRCVPACSCVGHKSCSCVGHKSCSCVGHTSCSCVGHSSGRVTGCRCAPVH